MTKITDEMVQKAAHAGIGTTPWPGANLAPDGRLYYSGFDLRAALEAVAPAIRKAALDEAETRIGEALAAQRDLWDVLMQGYRDAGMKEDASAANQRRAAFNHAVSIAAIRTLADKEGT